MKRRRTLIVSLLLVAALCLGIGYAALGGDLKINGTATVLEQPFSVVFTKFEAGSGTQNKFGNTPTISCTETLEDNISSSQVATLTVDKLQVKGEQITATLTIKNFNDCTVSIAKPVIDESSTYINVTTDWGDAAKQLAPNGTIDVVVTVQLEKEYTGTGSTLNEETDESFTITFTATEYVAP